MVAALETPQLSPEGRDRAITFMRIYRSAAPLNELSPRTLVLVAASDMAERLEWEILPAARANGLGVLAWGMTFGACFPLLWLVTGQARDSMSIFLGIVALMSLLPSMAGAADRCIIPEFPANAEHLTELMTYDRNRNPSRYAVVLVSEGATLTGTDSSINHGNRT